MGHLSRLLHPRSLALIGGEPASEALRQCRLLGFEGNIWRVHPEKKEDQGVPCFGDVADLPAAPDIGWVGINREATIGVVRTLAERGAGGAICYASGFNETGDEQGETLTRQLLQAAGNMPLIGPNCYGLINYLDGAPCWPDQQGGSRIERGVALLSQSSNIALNMTMQRRGTPFAYVAALGNQIQMDFSDIGIALLDEECVSAIGLHIEGIRDIGKFLLLAKKAREHRIPVVALVVGRSESAQVAKLSHTASMTGFNSVAEAFFERLGVPLLPSLPVMLETLKLLHVHGALPGRDICSLSCSGGEAALIGDAAMERNLYFRPLSKNGRKRVGATTNPLVDVANPLDYHTFDWGREEPLRATFTAMLEEDFDLSMLVLDFPRPLRCLDANWRSVLRAFESAAKTTRATAAVVATLHENMPEDQAMQLIAQAIAPLCGIEDALTAVDAAARIHEAWKKPFPEALVATASRPVSIEATPMLLDECQAKQLLRSFSVPVPEGMRVASISEVREVGARLGYPLVAKALGLAHKSERCGVRLGIHDESQLVTAVEGLLSLGEAVLVERMITRVVAEMIIGVLMDSDYGLVMSIGAGGIWTEMLDDACLLLLPASRSEIGGALARLRMWPILRGARGGTKADVTAIVDAATALGDCGLAHRETLLELDVNPLLVLAEGEGVVAADALMRIKESPDRRMMHL